MEEKFEQMTKDYLCGPTKPYYLEDARAAIEGHGRKIIKEYGEISFMTLFTFFIFTVDWEMGRMVKRNSIMVKRIISELEEKHHKSMFIAVGLDHLLGNVSIPEMLKENGYEVRRVKSGDIINPEGPREHQNDEHKNDDDDDDQDEHKKPNSPKPSKGEVCRSVPNPVLIGIIAMYFLAK